MSLRSLFSRRPASPPPALALVPPPDPEEAARLAKLRRRLEELDAQLTPAAVRAADAADAELEVAARLELARVVAARFERAARTQHLGEERKSVRIALGEDPLTLMVSELPLHVSAEPVRALLDREIAELPQGRLRQLLTWLRPETYPTWW